MVAQPRPAAEPPRPDPLPGPGPTPTEVYPPGTVVRLRVTAQVPAALAPLVSLVPGSGTYVVAGVIREETLFGRTLLYRLIHSGASFLADPANVIRVEPEPRTAFPEAIHGWTVSGPTSGSAPCARAEPDNALRWVQSSGSVLESACGRFFVEMCSGGTWGALDRWTGEEVAGLSLRESAEQWCRVRTQDLPVLNWRADPYATFGEYARTDRGDFGREPETGAPKAVWVGSDCRFDEGHPLRRSGRFDALETAKRWCAVRAGCAVEGDPDAADCRLRWDPPLPL